jgi:protein-tyrosine-phosphatase
MTNRGHHILLVGGDPADALAWCRRLASAGHRATLLRWNERVSFADASRHCSGSVWLGDVDAGVAAWRARLDGLLRPGTFTHLWPADALAHELLCTPAWQTPHTVRLIGPQADAYARASDRCEAMAVARRAGLSVLAGTHLPQGTSPASIDPASFGWPCVARPQRAAGIHDDEPARYTVKTIADARALDNKLRDDLPRVGVLLQAAMPGARVGLCLAAVAGNVETVSPSPEPQLLDAVRSMVSQLNWSGLLHVECRRLAGETVFVDLQFGLAGWAGVDAIGARSAVRAMVGTPGCAARAVPWLDPLPAAARLAQRAARALSKASVAARAGWYGVAGGTTPIRLHPSDSILFVCQGNINRSLVAEHALRRAGFRQVASAALIGMAGRLPSGPAERYVRDVIGLPAEALRSRSLRRALAALNRVDVVVCFERRQVVEVLRRHPHLKGRVHLLTRLAGPFDGPLDIADPHGRDDAFHRHCFDRIAGLLQRATNPAAVVPRLAPGRP